MKVKIIFNNEVINSTFSIGWGFSAFVDNRILFDTGESPDLLCNNMKLMNININDIKSVVISHDHWDHTNGLWEILKKRKGLNVYACSDFSSEFKKKVKKFGGNIIETNKCTEVSKNIFTTGEIPGTYHDQNMPEQSLVIKTKNGITVITGCAHPGICRIVKKVKEEFSENPIYLVFGGFHLMEDDKRLIDLVVNKFKEMKVQKVGPTHCTGKEAENIFEDKYKKDFIAVKAGQTLNI